MVVVGWRWRYPVGYPAIELPSGPIGPRDDPLAAAQAALRDSCGLAARDWAKVGKIVVATGNAAQDVFLFRAERLHRVPQPPGNGAWLPSTLPYGLAVACAGCGTIEEAGSVAALLLADRQPQQGAWQLPKPERLQLPVVTTRLFPI